MRYSYTIPSGIAVPADPVRFASIVRPIAHRAEADVRWPMIVRKLRALRDRGRRSIRIVDASCGAGELLLAAVRRARALGFVAIEGRGVDSDPRLIARARQAARTAADPAIGLEFETGEACDALREEAEFPADLVLYAGQADRADPIDAAARAAGTTVLRDAAPRRIAA